MKKLVISIISLLGMVACTTVRFESPQPADSISLEEFPEELQGSFITDENDTLEVSPFEFYFRNGEEIFISGNLMTSEEVALRKFKNMYVLNLKDEGAWDAFPVKVRRNKLIIYYEKANGDIQELIEDLSLTTQVKEIPDTDEHFGYYLVNPSAEEFEKLWNKKLFSDKLIFYRESKK